MPCFFLAVVIQSVREERAKLEEEEPQHVEEEPTKEAVEVAVVETLVAEEEILEGDNIKPMTVAEPDVDVVVGCEEEPVDAGGPAVESVESGQPVCEAAGEGRGDYKWADRDEKGYRVSRRRG